MPSRPPCLSLTDAQMRAVTDIARLVPHRFRPHYLDHIQYLLAIHGDDDTCSGFYGGVDAGYPDSLIFDVCAAALGAFGTAVSRAGHA
jgi:hypothetical protein